MVKILSFTLIPALVFAFITSIYLSFYDTRDEQDLELLMVGYDNRDYFFDRQLRPALDIACEIARYGSTESIEQGMYLELQSLGDGRYAFQDTMTGEDWIYVEDPDEISDSGQFEERMESAVRQQLDYYLSLQASLFDYGDKGLNFQIEGSDGFICTNVTDRKARGIPSMPMHITYDNGWEYTRSKTYTGYDLPKGVRISLGYDQEGIRAVQDQWRLIQAELWSKVVPALFIVVCGIFCFVVLLVGAGRRWDGDGTVRFGFWDKPWLDLSLCAVVVLEISLVMATLEGVFYYLGDYGSDAQFITVFALLSLLAVVPALGWIVSFVKRVKAGRWWRHTLVFTVISGLYRLIRSLWSGVGYAVRAAVVSVVTCVGGIALFYLLHPVGPLLATAASLLAALLYYKRLSQVKEGARMATRGIYEPPIPVTGGDLGDIAGSINNISAGINTAVEQRTRSERMKTELITNVSHDLRTPLTSVITYADLLKNEGLNSEKAPEYLEVLTQKAHRLKSLVDELFEAAKAATGNVEVNLESLNLADLIRQCLGELDEQVQASGLDFRLNLPEHAAVLADGRLFWRVMENLLGNAFKYAMPGSRVYIDITQEGEEVRLDVKNMSAHPLNVDLSELTERFTRGDASRGGEGSGLGLSIVQSFVQAQGGRFALNVDGDLFKATVYLPHGAYEPAAPRYIEADMSEI